MSLAPDTYLKNPFVGLRSFEKNEDHLFFGRDIETAELAKKLSKSRFLAVIGSSGTGKSSLVKSGLLPSVHGGFMKPGSNWRVAIMQPGEDPIRYLTKKLAEDGVLYDSASRKKDIPYESIIETGIRRSENGLVQMYKDAHLPATENLLVVVDQFEEIFRFSRYEKDNKLGKSDAMHFVQVLLTAAQQKEQPIYVLLTMRADFLGDCTEFRGLPEAINQGQYLVPRMTRDEIREAITGPVAVSGATISQRLVTRLLNDINNDTDQLPILQHAMMRTWDAWFKRNQHDTPIDFEDYDNIGTMQHALSLHADEAYNEIEDKKKMNCEMMFKALTDKAADVRGIRRPRSIEDLCLLTDATPADVMQQVEIFRKAGRTFLMPPPRIPLGNDSIIDISHESLMRVWDKLRVWSDEEVRQANIYKRLGYASVNESTIINGEKQGSLWGNPELALALIWRSRFKNETVLKTWAKSFPTDLNLALDFLKRSEEQEKARKRRAAKRQAFLRWVAVGLILLFATFAGVSLRLKQKAEDATAAAMQANKRDSASRAKALKETENALKARQNEVNALEREAASSADAAMSKKKEIDALKKDSMSTARLIDESKKLLSTEIEKNKQREIADIATRETILQNLKIAANEYARLIREGPSAENNNLHTFYDADYFLAYVHHFNKLKSMIDPKDMPAYRAVMNKLYYNNDMYQRTCEDFTFLGKDTAVIKEVPNSTADRTTNTSNRQYSVQFTGNNFITVLDKNTHALDSIGMGTKVTAVFMNDNSNIIYFGTETGYIGYISYSGNKKKYQPVFENRLGSQISSIELSRYNDDGSGEKNFLLAVAKKSNAVVFKLGDDKVPDKRLAGNILPYKKSYGDITGGRFKEGRVLLFTKDKTYSCNPFTSQLLNVLRAKRFDPLSDPAKTLITRPEVKFY